MKLRTQFETGVALLLLCVAGAAGHVAAQSGTASRLEPVNDICGRQLLREIDDFSSGARWLLVRDALNPGGPGRMVQLDADAPRLPGPVIRAGDRVLLEEHSDRIDLELEAVALSPAAPGQGLNVRLRIGGRVLRAVALSPGRAALATAPAGDRP